MDESAESQPAESPADQKQLEDGEATVLSSAPLLQVEDLPTGMTPRELAHALQGEMLDHFHLLKFIGGGGMGVVFKALDTTLDRVVAVKVVASHSLSTEDLQKRFLVEAQSAARLDHPNIARIYDTGRCRGLPYIVFEYVDAENVRDLVINHGPLPLGDALSYTYQIAHALIHASQRDVVHRDIKPSNILVTRDGRAKLVDMGLARLYQDAPDDELTNSGVTLGTFDYISPEQARDPREADSRSDIYSLGCTLFFMLAGYAPFSQGTPAQKLLQHQGDRPPEILDLRPDLPEEVGKLVQRMLAKQPENRPQSPGELVGMLADLLHSQGLPSPQTLHLPVVTVPRSPAAWRRHLPWALPIAVLLLLGGFLSIVTRELPPSAPWPMLRGTSGAASAEQSPSTLSSPMPEVESDLENRADNIPSTVASSEETVPTGARGSVAIDAGKELAADAPVDPFEDDRVAPVEPSPSTEGAALPSQDSSSEQPN